jgi:hypothetical protein
MTQRQSIHHEASNDIGMSLDHCYSSLYAHSVQLHTFEAKADPTTNLPKVFHTDATRGAGFRRAWLGDLHIRVRDMPAPRGSGRQSAESRIWRPSQMKIQIK